MRQAAAFPSGEGDCAEDKMAPTPVIKISSLMIGIELFMVFMWM